MLALLKEVVGAITMAEIVKLPRLGCGVSAAHHVLLDEDFNRAEVAGKIACIRVGLGYL
jgi:hypothetical protein